jgi:predicted transcriptional regulator
MKKPSRKVGDAVGPSSWDESGSNAPVWLAHLLEREGIDIMDATFLQLRRGTPVYVSADADLLEVQRLMARYHIRSLPVVRARCVVGILDLVELASVEHDLPETAF